MSMETEIIVHQDSSRCFETGNAKGLFGDADHFRRMLAFINAAEALDEPATPPDFGLRELARDRKGTWSVTVTKNWWLTFRLKEKNVIVDMNPEDYHGS